MIVGIDLIKEAISTQYPEIEALKKEHKKLRMHYYGTGKGEYLTQISGLENENQIKLRKKYGRSNKDLFSNLTGPINKIFSAKGKSKVYHFKQKETAEKFSQKLSTISSGKSLEDWLSDYWKEKIAADPNGLFLVEHKDGEAYPTYKSILSIRKYVPNGKKVEYIIFEPYKEIIDNVVNEYVRVYDDIGDSLYAITNGNVRLVEDESYLNPWGEVPAVIISDFEDTNTEYKKSSIDNEIELADEFLLGNSVKAIYKFAHGFPLFWMYLSPCSACKGTGQKAGKECTACNGTGQTLKKDVSDILGLKPPTDPDSVTIAPDVAGYVTPPSENLTQMTDELALLKDMMWFSQWGTVIVKGENETATGRFIDAQPVSDKLDTYKPALENTETLLVEYFAEFYYPEIFDGSSINYGNRFMIETPDQLLEKYTTAKKDKLSQSTLDYLLEQYYQGQFSSDATRLEYYTKLMKLEPWVHMTVNEIPDLYKGTDDYVKKMYFSEWVNSVKVQDIVMMDLQKLNKKLAEYIQTKKPEEVTDEPGNL